MDLYIVRHGKASQDSPSGADHDRPLKERGRRQSAWLGETIASASVRPAKILTSDIDRAMETARIIQGILEVPLEIDERLRIDLPPGRALGAIDHQNEPALMLVGHNPQLSLLVRSLTGIATAVLRTGQAAHVELEDDRARLIDLLRMPD